MKSWNISYSLTGKFWKKDAFETKNLKWEPSFEFQISKIGFPQQEEIFFVQKSPKLRSGTKESMKYNGDIHCPPQIYQAREAGLI